MADRMAEALTLDSSRSAAVDVLTAPSEPEILAEPDDVLSDLLAAEPAVGLAPEDQRDVLLLDRLKREKTRHEKSASALGKDIERIEKRLIELGVELGLIDKRGRLDLGAVDDGQGFMVKPYEVRKVWPKYRIDPATDQPYTRDQLIDALHAAGLDHLVVETTAQYDWPGYITERVQEWRQAAGAAGLRDDQGRYTDLDGELLDAIEAKDPIADIYALPRALRVVIEPVDQIRLQFTRRAAPVPVAPAGDDAAGAETAAGD